MSERGPCGECQHSRQAKQLGTVALYCFRRSPQAILIPQGKNGMGLAGVWPPVTPTDSCWDFVPAPAGPRTVNAGVREAIAGNGKHE